MKKVLYATVAIIIICTIIVVFRCLTHVEISAIEGLTPLTYHSPHISWL